MHLTDTAKKTAQTLISEGCVRSITFSGGTYQVEVVIDDEVFWPFLQFNDDKECSDSFCTCDSDEENAVCDHLAAAYLQIYRGHTLPIHMRYQESFWLALLKIAARRHGYTKDVLSTLESGKMQAQSSTGKLLFELEATNEKGKAFLQESINDHVEEVEDDSFKLSHLPQEEIELWRMGNPSHSLLFELSFWSDLAKELMLSQEEGASYTLTFKGKEGDVPNRVICKFPHISLSCYIAKVNWPSLISTLPSVDSPLKVHPFGHTAIDQITYDATKAQLHIESHAEDKVGAAPKGEGVALDAWRYFENKGFYPAKRDPILEKPQLESDEIEQFLQQHLDLMTKYAKEKIHLGPYTPQYTLFFDKEMSLHVHTYVIEPGDLEKETSRTFGNFVYLEEKGFYQIEPFLFEKIQHVVPKNSVAQFVDKHRIWLKQFETFQIHPTNIEEHITFSLDHKETLHFLSETEFFDASQEVWDFDNYLYVKDSGFYSKQSHKKFLNVSPGTSIPRASISRFIEKNEEELEALRGFFATNLPIEKISVVITLNSKGDITVNPDLILHQGTLPESVRRFGVHLYIEGEGFIAVPKHMRPPDKYLKKQVIQSDNIPLFLSSDLPRLTPFVSDLDPKLTSPETLRIKVRSIEKVDKDYLIDMQFKSEIGTETLLSMKEKLDTGSAYGITRCGLLDFKDARFNWLRQVVKEQVVNSGGLVRFTAFDWIKLAVFEEILAPSQKDKESFRLFTELSTFKNPDKPNLEGLLSTLRPYQLVGTEWLFALYSFGLSGLLCDEMGLGKTHQAMALIAAVRNSRSHMRSPIFVACPTSVIYHWEELLKNFLPSCRVHVYYGLDRTLPHYEDYDLLLTSYGLLRSDYKKLQHISFELSIFDEIQKAKNAQSKLHTACLALDTKMRLGLTGTPIENRLLELKALFDVILPTYFPGSAQFKEQFVNPIEKYNDQERKGVLSRLIDPFLLRRKKSEVLQDLPEKMEEIVYCDLSSKQDELYKKAYLSKRKEIEDDLNDETKSVSYFHIFSLLNTFKQICDHPALVTGEVNNYEEYPCGKWDLFVELLHEALDSKQKVVVFTQYLDMMKIMENYLRKEKIGFSAVRGSTRDRKAELVRFRDDPDCMVFVASLKAVGVGVDLTAGSVVIHYDRWWNPAVENQATDRVHRIGQNRGVQVFKCVTKGTIEEQIHAIIQRKLKLVEGVITYDEHDQLKALSRDDLIALFKELSNTYGS